MSTPSNRASNPAGKSPKPKTVSLDLTTARQMLPLVKSIAAEIADTHARLNQLGPEQESLDRTRRTLDWVGRRRRYAITDEISRAEKTLTDAVTELTSLGLKLVDPAAGQVDFPTRINGRSAAFTWQIGEEAVKFWHYTGEAQRRPIPPDWQSGTPIRYRGEP